MRNHALFTRATLTIALLILAAGPARLPLYAQEPTPIVMDEAGFGMAKVDLLEARSTADFTLALQAGDRVAMDLQGESDALAVSAFAAPWGALAMEGVPEAFNYLAWAPEEGTYSIVVENTGDAPAGFVLRVVVSPAPLPAAKILTLDADGETIPIAVGEAFQVALDAPGEDAFPWQLDVYDTSVVSEAGGSSMVLLGTMPGAMRQELFTFVGMAPGATTLAFANSSAEAGAPASFSATVEVTVADDATALGAELVTAFFDALQAGDADAVGAMLAPAFQLIRFSGERYDAANYLDNLPVFEAYALSNVHVTQDGDVLVVTYDVMTDATMDDGATDFGALAPRLSVFQQIDGAWKLLAHANLASTADNAAEGAASASIATTLVVDRKAQVAAGGTVELELPGNPTTGYIWQVVANDESILLPTGSQFTPASDAEGAGGIEKFSFHALAPGSVDLRMAQSQPWVTDEPPADTYTVTIEVIDTWPSDDASITVGMEENGQEVAILPGNVLMVVLDSAADGAWQLVQGDAMVVQPLGDWRKESAAGDATKATFKHAFLGVKGGTADLQFEFVPADGSAATATYELTVQVPPMAPGSSGAVEVTAAEAGQDFALAVGDTLVVRLAANPTTGYDWRVVSTNATLLPAGGDPQYAQAGELVGAGGVETFRFLARQAGEATVQLGEFPPGAEDADQTLDYNVTIFEPAPLTGNTVQWREADAGKPVTLTAGDMLDIELPAQPSTGYLWVLTENDGSVLRLQPESGFTADADAVGAPGVQEFLFRAMAPGTVNLVIGELPPGAAEPDKTLEVEVTVE